MMTEHVHGWYLDWIGDTVGGKCRGCPQTLLLNEIEARINEHAALKREIEMLLLGIRNARHCLTYGKPPIEGGRFDIGTTCALLDKLLLTAQEQEDA